MPNGSRAVGNCCRIVRLAGDCCCRDRADVLLSGDSPTSCLSRANRESPIQIRRGCILRTKIFGSLVFLFFPVTLCGQTSSGSWRGIVKDASRAKIAEEKVGAQLVGTAQT